MVERRLQMPAHGLELLALEEPFADVVLAQHRDVWPVQQLARLHREREHPLQVGELAD